MVVRRASQVQNVPQVMRPHRLPVTNEIPMNSTPTSAEAPAMRSQVSERVRFQRYAADETPVTMNAR
ncbi:unannotated protein [freshwater metagenome]|uniref:Unannotated protein n=1 Tax=freshwater metagenome TaxID=449393 RepID=A0A6J6GR96_9ZZZZ